MLASDCELSLKCLRGAEWTSQTQTIDSTRGSSNWLGQYLCFTVLTVLIFLIKTWVTEYICGYWTVFPMQ